MFPLKKYVCIFFSFLAAVFCPKKSSNCLKNIVLPNSGGDCSPPARTPMHHIAQIYTHSLSSLSFIMPTEA